MLEWLTTIFCSFVPSRKGLNSFQLKKSDTEKQTTRGSMNKGYSLIHRLQYYLTRITKGLQKQQAEAYDER